jgi:hypothetical protein
MTRDWRKRAEREERDRLELEAQADEHYKRRKECWQVPEHAKDAYLELEDALGYEGARVLNNFLKALLKLEGTPYST